MRTPEDVFADAALYLRIYIGGISGLLIYNMGSGILRAVGDSTRPLYFLMLTSVLNIVLDLFFVLVLKAGIAGAAIATIENPTNGYDDTVDYAALNGTKISIAVTPVPHEEVVKDVVVGLLAEKGITLEVIEVTDYVTPNTLVDGGDVFANYFAHQPYQDSFNKENGSHLVTVAGIHVEPMALYGGKQETLEALGVAK